MKKDQLTIPIATFGKGSKKKKKGERHRAGGYYAPHVGKPDPDAGLTPLQKRKNKQSKKFPQEHYA